MSKLIIPADVGTGWWSISDNTYTNASPFSILSDTRTKLPINVDVFNDSFAPKGTDISNIYDSLNNKITPIEVGDSYLFRLDLTANPTLNNRNFTIDLDINGAVGIVLERSTRLARGATIDTKISITNSIFCLDTFVQNGGEFYVTCDGDVDVFNISLFIQRITKS